MHDSEFYAAVARELRAGAPVLHSVVHTHRHVEPTRLRNGRPMKLPPVEGGSPTSADATATTTSSSSPSGALNLDGIDTASLPAKASTAPSSPREGASSAKEGLEAELERINTNLHVWKVQRLSNQLQEKRGKDAQEEMEVQMEERLRRRQEMEQNRALRRIEQIVRTVEPQISRTIEENAALRAAEEERERREGVYPQPGAGPRYELPTASKLRLELRQHDKEREERTERRVQEIATSTCSWLVERDLQRKYEERASCERQHAFQRSLTAFDEESERREIFIRFGIGRLALGLMRDEEHFRAVVESREEEMRTGLLNRLVQSLQRHQREMECHNKSRAVLARQRAKELQEGEDSSSTDDDDDDEDDEDQDQDDDVGATNTGEEERLKTPPIVVYDDTVVDDRLPLPPPPGQPEPKPFGLASLEEEEQEQQEEEPPQHHQEEEGADEEQEDRMKQSSAADDEENLEREERSELVVVAEMEEERAEAADEPVESAGVGAAEIENTETDAAAEMDNAVNGAVDGAVEVENAETDDAQADGAVNDAFEGECAEGGDAQTENAVRCPVENENTEATDPQV